MVGMTFLVAESRWFRRRSGAMWEVTAISWRDHRNPRLPPHPGNRNNECQSGVDYAPRGGVLSSPLNSCQFVEFVAASLATNSTNFTKTTAPFGCHWFDSDCGVS